MSTIVVAKKDGYVAIGADTLTKLGCTKESSGYIEGDSKILKVGASSIALVGHASWGLVLSSCFSQMEKSPDLTSRQSIFEMSRELHKTLKEKYSLNPTEDEDDPFESSQFDCLIANASGIFGLYSLRSVQEYTKFYAFGCGYKFALGAMRVAYQTAASAEDVAKAGLEAAADFDDSTGLPIEVYAVKLNG